MSRITDNTSRQEASRTTRTYDLVAEVRHRRFVWLGHILRMDNERLVKIAAKVQFANRKPGDLFMDAPAAGTFEELVDIAKNRKRWQRLGEKLAPRPKPQIPTPTISITTNNPTTAPRDPPTTTSPNSQQTLASDAASAVFQATQMDRSRRRNPPRKCKHTTATDSMATITTATDNTTPASRTVNGQTKPTQRAKLK